MKIHCVGNSHVNNFSGDDKINFNNSVDDRFEIYHLGPVVAYNFISCYMTNTLSVLQKIYKEDDFVTIVVGEVDCRLHIPLQADKHNIEDSDMVRDVSERFFLCYDELIKKNYKVFCLGTHPTTTEDHNMTDGRRPIYGDVIRRNKICVLWNDNMKELSKKRNIPFIDIYNNLVDEKNLTKMDFFLDYCHLNSKKVLPFYIDELKKNNIL